MKVSFKKVSNFLLVIFVISFVVSFFALKKLPDSALVLSSLNQEPIQTTTEKEKFSFDYRETKYNVQPVADYELWGMIVTHNDIGKWYNYYHDKNSVNIKDFCVVWGNNLENNLHQKLKYRSGEWMCYVRGSSESYGKFDSHKFSNNHLLSDDKAIRDVIRKARVGDQIYLKGFLANYGTDERGYYRLSSLTREDSGNGACETFFVEEAEILRRGNSFWYLVKSISKWGVLIVLLAKFGFLVYKSSKLKTRLVREED